MNDWTWMLPRALRRRGHLVRQGAVNKQKLVYKMKFPYYWYYSFSARGEEFATTRGSRDPASFCFFVKDFESKFGSVMRLWEEF